MAEKRGFFSWMWHKKYYYREFLEPLLALPFAYALLRILEAQFNTLTFIIIFVLLMVYLPAIVVFVEGKRYS
jgi:type III secretory pathway component EscU